MVFKLEWSQETTATLIYIFMEMRFEKRKTRDVLLDSLKVIKRCEITLIALLLSSFSCLH